MTQCIGNEQPSTTLPPKKIVGSYRWQDGEHGTEYDIGPYQVCSRQGWDGSNSMMLQVCRADGGSVFDWRHLQQIKNQVCGPEWEAVELFPAESRLRDPSNARYLWCRQQRFPFGMTGGRIVLDSHEAIAPQRAFGHHTEIAQ